MSVTFAPGGGIAATTGKDQTVRLWNLAEGRELATLAGQTQAVLTAAFSPDGKTLVTCSYRPDRTDASGEVILWDVASRSKRLTLETASGEWSWSLAFSPDGKLLATATTRARSGSGTSAVRNPFRSCPPQIPTRLCPCRDSSRSFPAEPIFSASGWPSLLRSGGSDLHEDLPPVHPEADQPEHRGDAIDSTIGSKLSLVADRSGPRPRWISS